MQVVRRRIDDVYELFPQLRERRAQLAGTMSGGEQAMVSIGRGLMRAPKLLLVDEPSLGLSPIYVKQNFAIIRQIRERGVTVFLVEQNVHQTLAIADYGYVLSKGQVVAEGARRCARQKPRGAPGLLRLSSAPAAVALALGRRKHHLRRALFEAYLAKDGAP